MAKLSKTQATTLQKMYAFKEPLVRLPGGFWTCPSIVRDTRSIPVWWVSVQTVRGLERLGAIERSWIHADEWRDERRINYDWKG